MKSVILLSAFVAVAFAALNDDCNAGQGSCQYDSQCYTGTPASGLCPYDPSNVKCCPKVGQSCKSSTGNCMLTTHCGGTTYSGYCPGPSSVRCCVSSSGSGGSYPTKYGDFMRINPSGASSATARQDGLSYSGVAASNKLASNDYNRCLRYKSQFQSASSSTQIPVGLITAIASRESRCGGALDSNGYGDHGNGYGLMQVDKRYHSLQGGPYSSTHISQATNILISSINGVANNHRSWTKEQQMQGGVAAYNFGVGNVQSIGGMDIGTTGNDYSNDVVARAQWFHNNGFN
uniref:Lysozyme g n=1 Tax=Trichoplax sp. H2 MB-2014 TaxID=2020252 RepID=A0A292G2Q6_9METZ|nr:lysozyme [Trichoplax sp. H2 MB-2014]